MRFRIPFIILLLIVIVPAFLAQSRNVFLYGETSGSGSQGENYENRQRIKERFGIYNPIMLLVPSDGINSEVDLAKELETSEYVRDVQALVTLADPSIPRSLIPQSVKDRFVSQNYSRFIILLNSDEETSESYAAVDRIKEAAQKCYPDKWLMAGKSSSIADIKESVEIDSRQVMFFSILAVGIIVLLTFKSLSIPVILVAVIQASIWINMSIPYFQGSSLVYIGYLVVSSLQLGATIDYAILLTTRYMEFRLTEKPIQAAILAVKTAGVSVVTSALILTIAGYSEGIISKIHAISTIGNLLGRGAALSALMVLLILPILLSLFDSVIMRTTLNTSRIINNDGKGD